MPLIETKGAASAQGFGGIGGGSSGPVNYIEDVFSTYLYTGNGSTQTITNGIDLSGKGGLVWNKPRTSNSPYDYHVLVDTVRGADYRLFSNLTNAQSFNSSINTFTSTGFTSSGVDTNTNGTSFVSWTFREQPKFFDVVTYTFPGTSGIKTIPHNLGSAPGMIIGKQTDGSSGWFVYHRSLGIDKYILLNSTGAEATLTSIWGTTPPTSTDFYVNVSVTGFSGSWVWYLFAHNAGGFGLSGTDNVISCGSFTTDGSGNATVNLGYEPQFLLTKASSTTSYWAMMDTMRGLTANVGGDYMVQPNNSNAEVGPNYLYAINATGFTTASLSASTTYIYIAIRRGPMKVPTSGTSVFYPYSAAYPGSVVVTTGFTVDFQIQKDAANISDIRIVDRLRGVSTTPTSPSAAFPFLVTSSTAAEASGTGTTLNWTNTGFTVGSTYGTDPKTVALNVRRAPGFFDVVCYTGNGTAGATQAHNLGVVPELIIIKNRSSGGTGWPVYAASEGITKAGDLRLTDQFYTYGSTFFNSTLPTATTITLGGNSDVNGSGANYVAYLFATCAGVSKVGSYTGTGTTLQVNCGFTGGAKFVLIKRTDSTGDWYVWDSARGIVAGNDPYLLLNSTAAEVTGTDYVDTYSAGFEISSTAPAGINANGGTFIFLAIA